MRSSLPFIRSVILLCSIFLFTLHSKSQSITSGDGKFEVGLGLGSMFFLGDLGGSAGVGKTFIKDLDLPLTKLNKGIYINYYPVEWASLRIAGNLGYVEGDDAQAPDKGGAEMDRRERGLNFRSKISEAYIAAELYPTWFFEKYDGLKGKLRPYVLGGVGIYHFNPEAKDVDGSWVKLAPLRLEGQGFPQYPDSKPYKLTQANVLMGFGFKYYVKERMYIGLEILHRKLFTDYVDDVSHDYYVDPIHFDQNLPAADAVVARRLYYRGYYTFPASMPYPEFAERGDPKQNDAYFSTIFRLGWRINNDERTKQLRCPVFY
ncbi:MAG: hypothetical protein IPH18_16820 [Chitinophagaceae bacterium]|nr:hypothetical protein [Chitinophagaceae bacterium]MBK8952283.1 hypothetical protein [Chitinophagaceae bacterium]